MSGSSRVFRTVLLSRKEPSHLGQIDHDPSGIARPGLDAIPGAAGWAYCEELKGVVDAWLGDVQGGPTNLTTKFIELGRPDRVVAEDGAGRP